MRSLGVDTLIEIGHGRILTGLARRIDADLKLINVEDLSGAESAAVALDAAAGGGS